MNFASLLTITNRIAKMKPQYYIFKRTIEANPVKIKIVFKCFLKLNIDMHSKTIVQFIELINMIIIYLKKSEFQFKTEILYEWITFKSNIEKLHNQNYDQTHFIEEFIDDFIFIDNLIN
jgi:hypothetical protein